MADQKFSPSKYLEPMKEIEATGSTCVIGMATRLSVMQSIKARNLT